jgi:phage baseplate assembly protein gpV
VNPTASLTGDTTDRAMLPDLVGIVQSIVRSQLAAIRVAEIGIVTKVYPHASGSDKLNYECAVTLRDSGLELPKVPVATSRIGLAAIPNVDDMVLVTFVGGSLHGAVITGRLYNDVDRPPEGKAKECVYVSPDDDESGVRRLHVELPKGNLLTVEDDKTVLDLGGTKVTIQNGGDVEIDCQGKIAIKSKGNTEIVSGGDLTLEATGALSLKAGTDLKAEGLSVAIKGSTSAQLEGQASATLKGPLVSIAGTTSVSPS